MADEMDAFWVRREAANIRHLARKEVLLPGDLVRALRGRMTRRLRTMATKIERAHLLGMADE